MAGISASYISSTSFTLIGDRTAEFSQYRRVKASCGTDGIVYSHVVSSSYEAGTDLTTVVVADAVITVNLSEIWYGVVAIGAAGSFPIAGMNAFVEAGGSVPTDLAGLDTDGNARGSYALNLQTGRYSADAVASGAASIAIGYSSRASAENAIALGKGAYAQGTSSLSIGYYAKVESGYAHSMALGSYTKAYDAFAVAIGYFNKVYGGSYRGVCIGSINRIRATSPYSIVIGSLASVDVNSEGALAMGKNANTHAAYGIAAGTYSKVGYSGQKGLAIGHSAYSNAQSAIAIGASARVELPYAANLGGAILVRRSSAHFDSILASGPGAEVVFMSAETDLTALGTTAINMPTAGSYASKFYPTEVGMIVTEADTISAEPYLNFGSLSAAAQTSGKTAVGARERRTALDDYDGQTSLSAEITQAATATTMKGRFYWKGMFVQNE